jgi:hypothetical protein
MCICLFDCYRDTYMYTVCEQRVLHPRAFGRFHPTGVFNGIGRNPSTTVRQTHHLITRRKQTPDIRKQRDLRDCCAPALSTLSLPEEAPFINPTQLVNARVAAEPGPAPMPAY